MSLYPDGVELRVDREELADMGVERTLMSGLVGAYQWLRDNGRYRKSGMVTAQGIGAVGAGIRAGRSWSRISTRPGRCARMRRYRRPD